MLQAIINNVGSVQANSMQCMKAGGKLIFLTVMHVAKSTLVKQLPKLLSTLLRVDFKENGSSVIRQKSYCLMKLNLYCLEKSHLLSHSSRFKSIPSIIESPLNDQVLYLLSNKKLLLKIAAAQATLEIIQEHQFQQELLQRLEAENRRRLAEQIAEARMRRLKLEEEQATLQIMLEVENTSRQKVLEDKRRELERLEELKQ